MENIEERPLSPVLTSNSRKLRKKSRINLTKRFSSENSKTSQISQGSITTTSDANSDIDKNILDSKQTVQLLTNLDNLEKTKLEQSISSQNQIVESFQTANGQNIVFSNSSVKNCSNIFDDILNPSQEKILKCRNKKFSFLTKNNANDLEISESEGSLINEKKFDNISHNRNDTFANVTVIEREICGKIKGNLSHDLNFKGFSDTEITNINDKLKEYTKFNNNKNVRYNLKRSNAHFKDETGQSSKRIKRYKEHVNDFVVKPDDPLLFEENLEQNAFLASEITVDEKFNKIDNLVNNESNLGFESTNKIFEVDLAKESKLFKENNESGRNISSTGFSSASGKDIKIPQTSLQKLNQLFGDPDFQEISNANSAFTSGAKNIFTSQSDSSTAHNFSIANIKQLKNKENGNVQSLPKIGFASASGKSIITQTSSEKLKKLFNDPDFCEINNVSSQFISSSKNITRNQDVTNINNQMLEDPLLNKDKSSGIKNISDFDSASGKRIYMPQKSLERLDKIFNDPDFQPICNNTEFTNGFGGVSNITKIKETKTEEDNGDLVDKNKKEDNKCTKELFATSDKGVNDPKNALQRILNDSDFQEIASNSNFMSSFKNVPNFKSIFKIDKSKTNTLKTSNSLEKTNTGKCLNYQEKVDSNPILQSNYKNNNVTTNSENKQLRNNAMDKSLPRKTLGVRRTKPIEISRDEFLRVQHIVEEFNVMSPIKPSSSKPERDLPTCSTPLKINQEDFVMDVTITPIKNEATMVNQVDRSVVISERQENFENLTKHFDNERRILENKLKLIMERQNALIIQKKLLETNCPEHRKKRPGVLYQKKQSEGRINLLNFIVPNCGQTAFKQITPQNAEFVNFRCIENSSIVNTYDGAFLIPNPDNLIGLPEIKLGFKTIPGVDPKLIPRHWIENHYKWIVWKLASYEHFSSNLKKCLCVENIMQQLKYRYDREIDLSHRPTLRKIFEKDDVPQKRMVLCISNIIKLKNAQFELELTDGWYSIRTIIDEVLNVQCLNGKIRIGTKLIVSGAELLNCEGCHPLEASEAIRLKINGNSTRRVIWHAKLGYQQFPDPFCLMLKSIIPTGGLVGCIKVYIARIYPIKYLEKQGKLSVWRNKKADDIRAQTWENDRMKQLELVKEIARKDLERSRQSSLDKKSNFNYTENEIKNITCPETLYNLMNTSKDPDSLQELLNESQIASIKEYQHQMVLKQEQQMRIKIENSIDKQHFVKRDVMAVLQLNIIDTIDTNDDKGRILQIWHPTENHLEMLKENSIFFIYNTLPNKNGALSTISRTTFKQVFEDTERFKKYQRAILPIKAFIDDTFKFQQFKEFDTIGVIIEVSIDTSSQLLWLADFTGQLMLVNIFNGPKTCALLDDLKCGQIVAVSNLMFSSVKKHFIEAIGNHSTVVTCYPQQKYLQTGMEHFIQQMTKDIQQFVSDCKNKISLCTDRHNAGKSHMLSTSSTSPLLDDTLEDSTLNYSRLTSTDIAMSLIDIDDFM